MPGYFEDRTQPEQPAAFSLSRGRGQVEIRWRSPRPGTVAAITASVASTFDPRQHSLLRSTVLVLGSLLAAFLLAGYPDDRPSLLLSIPLLTGLAGFADTFRCLRARWDLYHGAVVVMLYMDVMALSIIVFLFLYPYGKWIM